MVECDSSKTEDRPEAHSEKTHSNIYDEVFCKNSNKLSAILTKAPS